MWGKEQMPVSRSFSHKSFFLKIIKAQSYMTHEQDVTGLISGSASILFKD